MREFGRVATRFWNDKRIKPMSRDAKLLASYLMTGPEANIVGCFVCSPYHVAASKLMSPEEAEGVFSELCDAGFIEYDKETDICLVIRFLKHNPIQNPNGGTGAIKALALLPESELINKAAQMLITFERFLPDGWAKSLGVQLQQVKPSPQPLVEPLGQQFGQHGDGDGDGKKRGKSAHPGVDNSSPPVGATGKVLKIPPPSFEQLKTMKEMREERCLTEAAVCLAVGVEKLSKSDVTAAMEFIRSAPKQDPGEGGSVAASNRNALIREVEKIFHDSGAEKAREWASNQGEHHMSLIRHLEFVEID